MFSFFKKRRDATESGVRPASPGQSSPVFAIQSEKADDNTLLDSLTSLSMINSISVVQHGARLAVVGELLDSVLTNLPAAMRADIVESFRDRIENVMSLADDRSLPEQ